MDEKEKFCGCGHSVTKHGNFGCLQGFCKCETTKAELEHVDRLVLVAQQMNYALMSVIHDRPSVHSDEVWQKVNAAHDAYEALKAKTAAGE